MSQSDPFLAEAQRRGLLTAAQADECRRLAASFAEVKAEMTVDEIAARKGFVSAAQAGEIRRALAKKRVGRYEVLERLGEGAGGIVWKARDTKLGRVVALKVLSQKAQATPEFRERFQREARTAATLNHVNIVRGLDHGEADGYQYFAMEFVEGEDAETRLARTGRFPEKEAVAMALDVVRALIHVRELHLVHRDIKPGNLIITPDGHVKLGDLGLAKPFLDEHELTAGDGSTAGTPYYMSPEQIRTPDAVDWRADVYSLGATLYHLLTGRPPFRPDAKGGVIQKQLEEKAQSPREHVLEIGDGAASVVLRMLQKRPEDRYDSLEALEADLESVLAGRTPTHVEPPIPPEEQTEQRHARHAVARRITAETLPPEPFPWTTLSYFLLFVGAMIVVGSSVYVAKVATKPATPKTPPEPPKTPGAPPPSVPTVRDPMTPPPIGTTPTPAEALEARVRDDFAKHVAERVQPHVEAGRFTSARTELAAFAERFPDGAAARTAKGLVDEERRRIDLIALGRLDGKLAEAKAAGERHDFDAAAALLDQAARMETPWAEEKTAEARAAVEASRRAFARAREEQARAFADVYGETLLAAGSSGVAAARAFVDAEAGALSAYDEELADLRRDLDQIAKSGTDASVIYDNDARGAYALLLAQLAHGEIVQAERTAESVRKWKGDAEEALERIAHVRGALARRADAVLEKAEAARAAGRLDDAFAVAEGARKILPDHAPTRVMQGRVRLEQRRWDEAKRLLADAARGRGAPLDAHLWYGRALLVAKDDLARAESEIREFKDGAARGDPRLADAEAWLKEAHALRVEGEAKRWRQTAKAPRRMGDADRVEGAWSRVVELLPDDVEALLALGQIYVARRDKVAAWVVLTRVQELSADPQKKSAAASLLNEVRRPSVVPSGDGREVAADADRYFAREAWDKAIDGYSAALAVSPYLSAARASLVRAYLARFRETGVVGDANIAVKVADELVLRFPEDAASLALRSAARLAAGDKAGALTDGSNALLLDGKCAPAALAKAAAQLAGGDVKDAERTFRAAYDLDRGPEALLGLARCRLADSDFAGARDLLDELKERHGVPRELEREFHELLRRSAEGR